MAIFGAPSSTPGGNRDMRPLGFYRKFNAEQLLFESFFDTIDIFRSTRQSESTFQFQYIIIHQK